MWLIPDSELRVLCANSMTIPCVTLFIAFGLTAMPRGVVCPMEPTAPSADVSTATLTTGRVLCTSVSDGGSRYEVKLKGLGSKPAADDQGFSSSGRAWTQMDENDPLPPELCRMWVPGATDLVFKFESPTADTAAKDVPSGVPSEVVHGDGHEQLAQDYEPGQGLQQVTEGDEVGSLTQLLGGDEGVAMDGGDAIEE